MHSHQILETVNHPVGHRDNLRRGIRVFFLAVAIAPTLVLAGQQGTLKPYDQLITGQATTQKGIFNIHSVNGRTYLEIPKALFGRDVLWTVERGNMGAVPAPGVGFPVSAATLTSLMVRFERMGDKVFVRNLTPSLGRRTGEKPIGPAQLPTSEQKVPPMERAVAESALAPTLLAVPVATESPSGALVMDLTDTLQRSVPEFGLGKVFGAAQIDPNRSYIESTKAFPRNVLIVSYLTAMPLTGGDSLSATVKHNLTLLPDQPMKTRAFDNRVGFFTVDFEKYTEDSNSGVINSSYIRRYRLEKKDPKLAVSDVVKPIVYYVGRSIPAKWRPYVRQGIEDWQVAFEAAGFKNAIIAKDAPLESEDSNWDPGDTRHSVVRWIANPVVNAIGPNVADPRTGEILSAHILIWENVLKLTNSWYYTMCAGVDPRARTWPISDEVTGRMLRYAVSHEVGHSIGLRHNHRASTAYTVAQLRDPAFTAKYGSTASIMAYGRMNYVAQPEDNVAPESLVPKIGPYDFHAIQWGYGEIPAAQEAATLNQWASQSLKNPWLSFGGEDLAAMVDPNVLTQNIGKERVEATRLGMLNLKRAMQYLVRAVESKNTDYDNLYDAWIAVLDCRYLYLDSVAKLIGGREETRSAVGAGQQFKPVTKQQQKEAVAYLLSEGLNWDPVYYPGDILNNALPFNVSGDLRRYQGLLLANMFGPMKIVQLGDSGIGGQNPYSLAEYINDVTRGVFLEAENSKKPDLFRRALQREFFVVAESRLGVTMSDEARLYAAVGAPDFIVEAMSSAVKTDYKIALKLALDGLVDRMEAAQKSAPDPETAAHWIDCLNSARKLLAR